jgi:hypothetical protein
LKCGDTHRRVDESSPGISATTWTQTIATHSGYMFAKEVEMCPLITSPVTRAVKVQSVLAADSKFAQQRHAKGTACFKDETTQRISTKLDTAGVSLALDFASYSSNTIPISHT